MYLMSNLMIFIIGIWVFVSKRKHLLMTLLILEFLVLGIFMGYFISMSTLMMYFSLIYIVITACEGALGLSILVNLSRTHGGDYFKSFHMDY